MDNIASNMEKATLPGAHHIHLPHWIVILLLLFVPPVGWWHMWKNHRYHSWFPYLLWLNAAIMLGFAAYVIVHFYPLLTSIATATTYIFISHIGLLLLAIFEIIFGFYLLRVFKNEAILRRRILAVVIAFLFINTIAIPISQLIIHAVAQKTIAKTVYPATTQGKNPTPTRKISSADTFIINSVISTFPKETIWKQATYGTIKYTDFSNPKAKPKTLTGISQTGNETVSSIANAQAENKSYLKQNGWITDNNQAADGPGGSQWGYKKTMSGKTQILQLSYTNHSITPVPNQPIQFTCPCNLTYKLFLSNPF